MNDLSKQRVGTWEILRLGEPRNSKRYWLCRCVCGTERSVAEHSLKGGGSSGCGCNNRERLQVASTIHGHHWNGKPSLTYTSWKCMNSRCSHASNPSFERYGGAGITVCEEWRDSFPAFLRDMGERPSRSHTIHRLDNRKGYSLENCAWATKREQQNGRDCTVFLSHEGKTMAVADWAREVGIRLTLIHRRIKRGLPIHQILSKARVNGMTGKWKRCRKTTHSEA